MTACRSRRLACAIFVLLPILFALPGVSAAQPSTPVQPVPIPAGTVLVTDDFSNPASGFFAVENQFGTCKYDNGEFSVALGPASSGALFCTHREIARDFVAEIDVRLPGGGEEDGASLMVRAKQTGPGRFQGYVRLTVRPARGYVRLGVNTFDNGSWNPRTLAEADDHPAVNRGTATNRLGFKVLGSSFVAYVNGQEVLRAEDGTLPDGNIGLEVLGPRGSSTEARFDNFVVSEIGGE